MKKNRRSIVLNPKRPINKTYKQRCNPKIRNNKTVKDTSCLTPEVMRKVVKHYNRRVPNNPIQSADHKHPAILWNEMNERMRNQCKGNERCWINSVVTDKNEKTTLEEESFVPKKPEEWKRNPNMWLTNIDIENVLHQYEKVNPKFVLLGPTPIDFDKRQPNSECVENSLCHFNLKHQKNIGKTKIGIVFNTEPHEMSGEHWISMFIDLDEHFLMFFDSTGHGTPPQILEFVKRIKRQSKIYKIPLKQYFNRMRHQTGNSECGIYTLFFIITMLTGNAEFRKNNMNTEEKIQLFLKDFVIPDKYIEKYRDIYFD
jgi:hypothetical protein